MIYKYKNTPFRNKYISRVAIVLIMAILLQGFVVVDSVQGETVSSNLTVTIDSSTQITLKWNDYLSDEKYYYVEIKNEYGVFSKVDNGFPNRTTYTAFNLDPNKTYSYRITVMDSSNLTYVYSNEVSFRISDLDFPNFLEITPVSDKQIDLKWTYPDQKAYNTIIERRSEGSTEWYQVANIGVGQNTYSDSSIISGIKYYYKVRAYSEGNIRTAAYPDESTGKGAYSLLNRPTGLYGYALSQYHIQLKWQDNSFETAFIIERKSPNEGVFKQIAVVPQNFTAYVDEDDEDSPIEPDTLYIYRIKAVTGTAISEYSDQANVTSTYLRTPEALTSSCEDGTKIKLSWQDLTTGETGFEIWRKTESNPVWELYETIGRNSDTYLDLDVLNQSSYTYKIRAKVNGNSVYSNFSNETIIWTSTISAPTNLNFKVIKQREVKLNWEDTSSTEVGFIVERKVGFDGRWYQITNVAPNITEYTDKWVNEAEINYYRVKVYDRLNAANYSNEIIVTTKVPESPSNLQAYALSSKEIQLNWQDNSPIEKEYIIEVKQFYIFKEIGRVTANTTTFVHQEASPDRTYTYRVRAANGEIQSDNSNETTATTLKKVTFSDLGSVSWARVAIENLASKGVFKEINNSRFNPDEPITKGEYCSIIVRALTLKSVSAGRFADVTSKHIYYNEIMSAAKLGIVSKDKYNKIYPDKYITREEAGVMLSLALKSKGTPLPEANTGILKQFADYRLIPDKSAENIAAICNANILTGRIINGRNYIQATSNVTRAESAVMVYKALKLD